MTRVIHAITPGDHYSPRTGSAIPTVVHGLAGAAAEDQSRPRYEQFVALETTTYQPRYDSAASIEFDGVGAPTRNERLVDAALGRVGRPRRAAARYFSPMTQVLADLEPSIVLAHNAPVVPWLLRHSPHRVVLYAHNDILRSFSRYESGRALETVSAIVCVSESLADQLRKNLPGSFHGRVRVVLNGVDCEQFTPRPHAVPERLRVMFVGRMISDKGPDILLRAASLLNRTDVEIDLVGSAGFDRDAALTPYEQSLRALAAEARVPVTFHPFLPREQLPGLLQSADVMVVPSRWKDPCPLTVGEALAAGVPLVASRMGGIPEIVGSAALLIDNESPAQLAAAIERLADSPVLRTRLAGEARSRAESHDWAWAWSQLKSVLDDVRDAERLS
jgi:glycosyltransferase involved in cell wall biosynthesis